MRKLLLSAGLALLSLGATPAAAGDPPPKSDLTAPYDAAVAEAMQRGRQIYLYDQAGWHATDRMLLDFENQLDPRMRGYVVLPGAQAGTLSVIFYGDVEGKHLEFARYEMALDKIVSARLSIEGTRPALSPLAERLVAARDNAVREAIARRYDVCSTAGPPNFVTLPPGEDGMISVYLLTPPADNGTYPLGGHYRVDVGEDGKVVNSRRFMNSCFAPNFTEFTDTEGQPGTPTGFFVTHLLDPQPTEIHIFASFYLPIEMMLGTTQSRLVWGISKGECVSVVSLDEVIAGQD